MSEAQTNPRFFGRYEILHVLGHGGMGEVYLSRLSGAGGFEKLCVLKTILPGLTGSAEFVDRFHHEAKILVQLNHANIAQVLDMSVVDDKFYMALEYVPGLDLGRILDRARKQGVPIPVAVAVHIGQRIADALGYAHRKTDSDGTPLGIVHRDVSPQNVLVSYEGEVKVIDFGLAKSTARSKHTLPSTVLGKLGYMAPEQARGEDIDYRADIYACGVVMWELFAGRPLVPRGTMPEMIAAMSAPRVPPLAEVRPDVGPEISAAVMKALAVRPDGRYANAEEFGVALYEPVARNSPVVTPQKVGEFIRSLCPSEYEAQRKLLSQISAPLGKKRPGSGESPPGGVTDKRPSGVPPPVPGQLPDTVKLRPASAMAVASPGAAPPVDPTLIRPSEVRRLRLLSISLAVGVAVAVVAVGAGTWALVRHSSTRRAAESAQPPAQTGGPNERAERPAGAAGASASDKPEPPQTPVAPQVAVHEGPLRISVLPFKNVGGDKDLAYLAEGLTETAVTDFGQSPNVRLIERGQIDVDIKELEFSNSRYVDSKTRAAIGKIVGAEVVVVGAYQRAGHTVRVTARFVDVETGEVLHALKIEGPDAKALDIEDQLAAAVRSSLDPLRKRLRR